MKITPWDPFREMEEFMSRLPSSYQSQSLNNAFVPAVDVYETKKDVVLETPLAGIAPEDVEVSVEKGMLTIQGHHKNEHEVEEKNYYRKEVRSGSFYRQVALPVPVREEGIKASFEDGILKITCPKVAPSKGKKVSIDVKKGKKK